MKVLDDAAAPERVAHGLRLFTLPNALSILRMVLLAPVLILLQRPESNAQLAGIAVLIVAGLTDLADGALARWRGWVSPSGKIVDPVADKVLIGGLVIYLTIARGFPLWLLLLILVRDLALVIGAMLFLKRDRLVFAANRIGKLTTLVLSTLVLAYVVRFEAAYRLLTLASAAMVILSAISYTHRTLTIDAGSLGDDGEAPHG